MPSPVVVCDFGLLSNSCSRMPGPAEVQDSGLLSQWSPPYTCSCGVLSPPACSVTGGWFRPVSVDVPGLGPFLRRFLPWTYSHDVQQSSLAQVYSLRTPGRVPRPTEVSGF